MTLAAPAAQAHASLTRSQPQASENLSTAPARVQLWFSEQPEPRLSNIAVANEQRQQVDSGPAQFVAGDAAALVEQLQPDLSKGTYTVSWRTTSARDGHVLAGSFEFGIGIASRRQVVQSGSSQAAFSWPGAGIRWLNYLAFAVLFGVLVFESVVLGRVSPTERPSADSLHGRMEAVKRRCRALAEVLSGVGIAAASAAVVDQVWSSSHQLSREAFAMLANTPLGVVLLLRVMVALAIFALPVASTVWIHASGHRSLGAAAASVMHALRFGEVVRHSLLPCLLLLQLLLLALTSHALASPMAFRPDVGDRLGSPGSGRPVGGWSRNLFPGRAARHEMV